jgi:polysaccharide biosynthesis transport protein
MATAQPPRSVPPPPAIDIGDGDGDVIDLRAYAATLWRRKWAILLLVLVTTMVTTLVVQSQTPIYAAQATLLIDQQQRRVLSIEQIYAMEGSGREFLETQAALLRSRTLAARVVRELNLVQHPEFDPAQRAEPRIRLPDVRAWVANLRDLTGLLPVRLPAQLDAGESRDPDAAAARRVDAVAGALTSRTRVTPIRGTQMVTIAVEMADARSAARIANALGHAYIESQLDARMDMAMTATTWMNARLEDLRTTLRDAEQALQMFLDVENLVDVQGIATVATNELSMTSSRLNEAQRARVDAENQYRQVQAAHNAGDLDALLTLRVVLASGQVQQARTDEARARAQLDELSQRYEPRHPAMEAARTELQTARDNLNMQVQQVVIGVERNYELAVANERTLMRAFEATRGEVQDISRKEFRRIELQREVDTNRALFDTFLERLRETSATADLQTVSARIVDPAMTPGSPVRPNVRRAATSSALLALLAGMGLALLLESLTNTFRSIEDVENLLSLSVLGILPLSKQTKRAEVMRLYNSDKHRPFAESVRTLRTSLLLALAEREHPIIMVTSTLPGEGKTVTASNLALALAQHGRVLLVDGDMRRPSLGKSFGLQTGTVGLANLIAGNASIEECVRPIEELDLLPAGTVPPDPLQLLASPRFLEVMDTLARQYDCVVLDTPPLQAVSDAVMLSAAASAVVFVVQSERTPAPLAKRAVGVLLQNNAPVVGVALNQVDVQRAQRYGYRYAGYYDYYGYSRSKT